MQNPNLDKPEPKDSWPLITRIKLISPIINSRN